MADQAPCPDPHRAGSNSLRLDTGPVAPEESRKRAVSHRLSAQRRQREQFPHGLQGFGLQPLVCDFACIPYYKEGAYLWLVAFVATIGNCRAETK